MGGNAFNIEGRISVTDDASTQVAQATQRMMTQAVNEAATAGNQASSVFQKVADSLKAQGASIDQVTTALKGLGATQAEINQVTQAATPAVERLTAAHTAHAAAVGVSYREARLLGMVLGSELSPALGGAEAALLRVGVMATALSSGAAALTVGLVGLAAFVGGGFLSAFMAARKETEEFQRALDSVDASKVTGELDKLAEKVAESRRRAAATQSDPTGFSTLVQGSFDPRDWDWRAFGHYSVGGASEASDYYDQQRQLAADRAGVLRDRLRMLQGAAAMDSSQAAMQPAAERQAARYFQLERDQAGLQDFQIFDPAQRTYQQGLRTARNLGLEGQDEAAARQRAASGALLRQQSFDEMVAYQGAAERPYASEFQYGQGYDIRITIADQDRKLLADLTDIQNQSQVVGLASVERGIAGEFNYGQGGIDVFTPFRREQVAAQSQQMRLQMQGLRVAGTMPGATADQRDLLTLQEQELRSQELGLQRGRLDPNDVFGQQINDDASQRNLQLERQVLFARQQARNNPAAGFQVGLTDAADQFAQSGTRMETIAKDLADNMSKSMSSGFFDVITGNFKDLPNVAMKFGQDMVKNITDELSKFITGSILQQFRQALFGT